MADKIMQSIKKIISLLGVAILGASTSLAFPPYDHPWLIFISMTLFVWLLNAPWALGKKAGFGYGYWFYLGASWMYIQHWFSYYFRLNIHCGYLVSYLLTFGVCLYVAVYIGLVASAYKRLRTASNAFNLLLLVPSLWSLAELVRGEFFPRSWYVLAYTQVANPLLKGYFPLFGMYLVSWLILSLAGLVVYSLITRRYLLPGLGLAGFVAISYFLAGLQYTKPFGRPLKFALVQPNVASALSFDPLLVDLLETVVKNQIMLNPADVYVLPETVFGTRLENLGHGYLASLTELIKSRGAVLLFGSPFLSAEGHEQAGTLQIDDGGLGYVYIKRNLVPWGEQNPLAGTFLADYSEQVAGRSINMLPGPEEQEPASVKQQYLAINICYENSINDFVAASAIKSSIILNQSDLSWYGDTEMLAASLQFSQARALENQRYFLQDSNTGITAVIAPNGSVEKRLPSATMATLLAEVSGYRGRTPFQVWGNLPIWALCLLVISLAITLRQRAKNGAKKGVKLSSSKNVQT